MSSEPLAMCIVGHLVGDFLLQNDWMALNKKRHSFPCAVHCFVWTVCVCLFGRLPLWAAVPLFVTHFIQDRTNIISMYMSLIRQEQFASGPCAPWSSIVVDNTWHLATIAAVVAVANALVI